MSKAINFLHHQLDLPFKEVPSPNSNSVCLDLPDADWGALIRVNDALSKQYHQDQLTQRKARQSRYREDLDLQKSIRQMNEEGKNSQERRTIEDMMQRNQQELNQARVEAQSRRQQMKDLAHENKEIMSRYGGGRDYKERLQREHEQKVAES